MAAVLVVIGMAYGNTVAGSLAPGTVAALPREASAPTEPLGPHALPPHVVSAIGNCTSSPVIPACGYGTTTNTVPFGIADYGVSGYGHPSYYAYGTNMFLANFSWTSIYIYDSGVSPANEFTVQLNDVLTFVYGGKNYSFWIQDVATPTMGSSNQLVMGYEDNIWNFTCTSTTCNIPTSTFKGNGTNAGQYYYDVAGGTGSANKLSAPNWFHLETRAYINAAGAPVVRFCYIDKTMASLVCYDTVTFSFVKSAALLTKDYGFFVDGNQMNPLGLFDDSEVTVGGPGGGQSQINAGPSNIQMALDYWNGYNFESIPSAWNAGDDTGETITSEQSIWSNDGSGTPVTVQLNGTTRQDFENVAYQSGQVGVLQVWAPGTNTGTVVVHTEGWGYQYGTADVRLDPGTYHVWVNSTSSTDMGMCTITAGATLNITTGTPCTGGGGGGLSTTVPAANKASIDVGQGVYFNTTASGGSGTYTGYVWTVSPATGLSCTASTTAGSTYCTASASGNYTVSVTVTDSLGHTASATSASFQVYKDPTVAVPSPSATSITLGQSVTFTSGAGYPGSGTDVYTWSAAPAGTAGCTVTSKYVYTCTPTAIGTYTATILVTDSNKGTGSSTSSSVSVLSAGPTITSLTAAPAAADVGQTITWTVGVSGGTTPYSYAWSASATSFGCTMANSASITCVPTAAGSTYTVSVTVTDAASKVASATSTPAYVVSSDPTVTTPTPDHASIDVGQLVNFSSTASGGAGTLTYSWSVSPTSGLTCPASSTGLLACTGATAGSYQVTLTVTDANGFSVQGISSGFTVHPSVNLPAPTASPTSGSVGNLVTFTASPTGGTGTYTSYTWTSSASGLGCGTSTTSTLACTPTATGTYTVTAWVVDSDGGWATATSAQFSVTATGGVLTAAASANRTSGQAPLSVTFQGSATGGTPGYTWSWNFGDGTAVSTVEDPSHVFASAGTYTVVLTVTDSTGKTALATGVTITVSSAGTGNLVVSATVSSNPGSVGQTLTFDSSVAGGTAPLTYLWRFGDGGSSALAAPTHAFSNAGTYTVWLWVNDSAGHSAYATIVLTINGGASSGGLSTLGSLFGPLGLWGLLLVLVALIVVVAIVVAARRRKHPPEANAAQGPWSPMGAPGPYAPEGAVYAGAPGGPSSDGAAAAGYGAGYAGSAAMAAPAYPNDAVAPPPPQRNVTEETLSSPAPPRTSAAAVPDSDTVAPSLGDAPTSAAAAPPAAAPPPAPAPPPPPPAAAPPPAGRPIDEVAPDPFGPRPAPRQTRR